MRVAASALSPLVLVLAGCDSGEAPMRVLAADELHAVDEGESLRFRYNISAGHALAIHVQQVGADVRLAVTSPGAERAALDTPARRFRDEFLFVPVDRGGVVQVELSLTERIAIDPGIRLSVVDLSPRGRASPVGRLHELLARLSPVQSTLDEQQRARLVGLIEALAQSPDISDEQRALLLHRHAAFSFHALADWRTAERLAEQAATTYRNVRLTDAALRAEVLKAAALVEQSNEGRRTDRVELLRRAEEVLLACASGLHAAGDAFASAQARNHAGLASQNLGDAERAIAHFRAAAESFRAAGAQVSEAMALQNVAWVHFELGQYRLAKTLYQAPLEVYERADDVARLRSVLNNKALAHSITGDTDVAVALYRRAVGLQDRERDLSDLARSLHGIGAAYLRAGRPNRALPYFLEALPRRRAVQDGRGLASTLIAIGDIYRSRGDIDEALRHHQEAAGLGLGPADAAKARYALAIDLESAREFCAALTQLERILLSEMPAHLEIRALALLARGRIRGHLRDFAPALRDVDAAEELIAANGAVTHQPQVYLERARIQLASGDRGAALDALRRAATAVESIRLQTANPDLRATLLASRAAVFEELIDLLMENAERARRSGDAGAMRAWQLRGLEARERWQARTLLERRAKLDESAPDVQASSARLASDEAPVAHRRLSALYQDMRSAKSRLDQLRDRERIDSRRVAEVERQVELLRREIEQLEQENVFRNALPVATPLYGKDIQALAASLSAQTSLLVFSVGERRTWRWRIERDEIVANELPGRRKIEALVDRANSCLRNLGTGAPGDPASCNGETRELGDLLFGASLANGEGARVLVAADGPLLKLPFSALSIERKGSVSVAIANWELASIPSLTLYAARKPVNRARLSGVARVGIVTEGVSATRFPVQLAVAPGGSRELQVRPVPRKPDSGTAVLLDLMAVQPLDRLLDGGLPLAWRAFDVLHFGSHAYSDLEDPALSALDIPMRATDGIRFAKMHLGDVTRWRLDTDLVVLASCETAVGPLLPGEGSLSLAHAFMSAGADRVIASLWRIGDAATADLMVEFYRQLQDRGDPVSALAAAQKHMASTSRWRHPYFWAGLVAYE